MDCIIQFPISINFEAGLANGMQQEEIRGWEEGKLKVFLPPSLLVWNHCFWQWLPFSVTTAPVDSLLHASTPLQGFSKLILLLAPIGLTVVSVSCDCQPLQPQHPLLPGPYPYLHK